jgi:hypothetical protein
MCTFLPLPVSALEITPYELHFKLSPGQEQNKTVMVFNDSSEEASYRIYTEERYSDWFTFTPDKFTLGPLQSCEVTVALKPPLTSFGKHDTFIYIAPQLSGSGNPVALGMKLRVGIDISMTSQPAGNMSDTMWIIIVIAAGVLTTILLFFAVIRPLTRRY